MAEQLIASFDVGKRYVRKYRDGRVEIGTTPKTADPQPVKIVDEAPTLTKDQVAVKLPVEKWEVLKDGSVKVAYEVKTAEIVKEPILEATK